MTTFTISFGINGRESAWYLRNGPTGFQAIDIALLPGPKPGFTGVPQQLVVSYTSEAFAGELLYKDRVGADTQGGVTIVDQLPERTRRSCRPARRTCSWTASSMSTRSWGWATRRARGWC